MNICVTPPNNQILEKHEIGDFAEFAAARYGRHPAGEAYSPASLATFLQTASQAFAAGRVGGEHTLPLRALLTLSAVRRVVEMAVLKQGITLSERDPTITWLLALMAWAELGPDRRDVLYRWAQRWTIPVIDILGEEEPRFQCNYICGKCAACEGDAGILQNYPAFGSMVAVLAGSPLKQGRTRVGSERQFGISRRRKKLKLPQNSLLLQVHLFCAMKKLPNL